LGREAIGYPMQKRLPSNVAWFEVLAYTSLGIGAIISILQWSQNVAHARVLGGAGFVLFVEAFVFAFTALFIWLIARRRKNWARWLFLIFALLRLPVYSRVLDQILRFNPVAGILSLVQFATQAVALFLIFAGNARDWFKRTIPT
jgi:hypothetical protein